MVKIKARKQKGGRRLGFVVGAVSLATILWWWGALFNIPEDILVTEGITNAEQLKPVAAKSANVQASNSKKANRDIEKPVKDAVEKKDAKPKAKAKSAAEPPRKVSCGSHTANSCQECPQGNGPSWCNGECEWDYQKSACISPGNIHPMLGKIVSRDDFQEVRTEQGHLVNIVMGKRPMDKYSISLVEEYKDDILFLGISSFENFPLSSPNPYSANFSDDLYRGLFSGFLTMMRHPDAYFDERTKTILLSQSDFGIEYPISFGKRYEHLPKKYDFTYSGTDQDVDNGCIGWSSFAKNWTFALEALEVMCSPEFDLRGVLVATKNKKATRSCKLPKACDGKMIQTTFLPNQTEFFEYVRASHFVFLPQIYDASPRVATQALSMNVPILMNKNIVGGWKYLNEETGEPFNDIGDFKHALRKIVDRSRSGDHYHPRDWIREHAGTERSGRKFKEWVEKSFPGRVEFPEGTQWILPWGS